MRMAGTYTEAQIQQVVNDRDPDIQRALKADTEHAAALKLQSAGRGKLARKRVKAERARIAALPHPEVKVKAATQTQANVCGRQLRQRLERERTGCQTDEVVIFEPTEDVKGEVPLHDAETLRAKRHLEKQLRESGTHSEVNIIRLLYGPSIVDAEHDVLGGSVLED